MLSGGERTRLRLAKMLCGKSNLLLMDEPTNHLDIGSRLTLEESLRQYDGAVVLVSHDRYFLDNVVTRVVEISDGVVTSYPGKYSEYLARKEALNTVGSKQTTVAVEPVKAPEPKPEVKETAEERRERQEREKNSRNRLKKVEREIEQHEDALYECEELVRSLENEMADPEVATDHQRVGELAKKLESARGKREEIETNWLALQEEKEELESVLG